jgi:hypothetical protein
MTWLRYLSFLAVAVFLRALLARFSTRPDQWLLLGSLGFGIAYILYDRGRWQSLLDRAGRATGPELDRLQAQASIEERAALQVQGALLPSDALGELEGTETFAYPPGSPLLLALLGGVCVLFGVGMLAPLVRGQLDDPANDWTLFIVGLLFLLAARGYSIMATFVGKTVRVDEQGLHETTRAGQTTTLRWSALLRPRRHLLSGSIAFTDPSGSTIVVSPRLRGYARFLFRVVAQLRLHQSAS